MSEIMYKIGSVGTGDKKWDEKGQTEIFQIFISYSGENTNEHGGRTRISSIQFQYAMNGRLVLSEVFGSQDLCAPGFSAVQLDYPSEYINGVSGYEDGQLEMLTFHTNVKSYGPFGKASNFSSGRKFDLQIGPSNQFGGLHGTHNNNCVRSLGLYMKPMTSIPNAVVSPSNTIVHL